MVHTYIYINVGFPKIGLQRGYRGYKRMFFGGFPFS